MLIKTTPVIPASEITDEKWYVRRREFIRLVGSAAVVAGASPWLQGCSAESVSADFAGTGGPAVPDGNADAMVLPSPHGSGERQPWSSVRTERGPRRHQGGRACSG